jgi:hypothetical protein
MWQAGRRGRRSGAARRTGDSPRPRLTHHHFRAFRINAKTPGPRPSGGDRVTEGCPRRTDPLRLPSLGRSDGRSSAPLAVGCGLLLSLCPLGRRRLRAALLGQRSSQLPHRVNERHHDTDHPTGEQRLHVSSPPRPRVASKALNEERRINVTGEPGALQPRPSRSKNREAGRVVRPPRCSMLPT